MLHNYRISAVIKVMICGIACTFVLKVHSIANLHKSPTGTVGFYSANQQ